MRLQVSSGLVSANLNYYFWSGHTVFPMGKLDKVLKDFLNVSKATLFIVQGKYRKRWW